MLARWVRTVGRAMVVGLLLGGTLGSARAGAHHEAPTPVPAGPRSTPTAVHPPAGSPIHDVSRDCGFSVELRDGRALWIFCDSTDGSPTTPPTWFLNNTAAITNPSQPTTLREPLDGAGRPYQFVGPTAYDPCGAHEHIIWPTAAVVVPAGARDRVLVYYENACLVGPNDITGVRSHSIGVAEYLYDPSADPLAGPIRARVLNPRLWEGDRQYGRAAAYGGDGFVYVYQCDWEWGDPWGCRVGRVRVGVVQDPGTYEFWDGARWTGDRGAAAFMTMREHDTPGVAYQVAWLEEIGVYAMTYVAWPGIGSKQKVRFARQPMGPWTPTMTIDLPGCGPDPWWCYAGTIHTQLTTIGALGLGYYDRLVPLSGLPANGRVFAYTQPVGHVHPTPHRFTDVWPDHRFFTEIEWLAAEGIAAGFSDGRFRPTLPITRAGFVAFLHRQAGAPDGPFPDPGFTDVPTDHPFHTEIAWMAATGRSMGFPNRTYRPTQAVTRQETAAFLYRSAGSS